VCPEKTASNNARNARNPGSPRNPRQTKASTAKPHQTTTAKPRQSAAESRQTKASIAKPRQSTTTKARQTTSAKTKAANKALPNMIAALSQKLANFGKRCCPWAKSKKSWLLLLLLFLLGFVVGVWRSAAAFRIQSPAAASIPMGTGSTGTKTTAAPQAGAATPTSVEAGVPGVQPLPELSNLIQQQTAGFDARLAEAIRESGVASLKTVHSSEFVRPCPGRVAETFGWKRDNSMGAWNLHAGVFLASPPNASIVAIASGQVARIEHNTLHGTLITIDHDSHWRSVYGHLSEITIVAGDPVTAGQIIGRVGLGPEGAEGLYFAVYHDGEPQDPQTLIPGL